MSKRIERFGESEATVTADETRLTIEVVTHTPELTARLHLTHSEAWKLADSIHACLEDQEAANVKVGDWVTYLPNGARLLVDAIGEDGTYTLVPSKDSEVGCTATAYEIQADADDASAAEGASAAPDFRTELMHLINYHSKENGSNTPDLILADYLEDALSAFDRATRRRERWSSAGVAQHGTDLTDESATP